jgi:hypothetical protein
MRVKVNNNISAIDLQWIKPANTCGPKNLVKRNIPMPEVNATNNSIDIRCCASSLSWTFLIREKLGS